MSPKKTVKTVKTMKEEKPSVIDETITDVSVKSISALRKANKAKREKLKALLLDELESGVKRQKTSSITKKYIAQHVFLYLTENEIEYNVFQASNIFDSAYELYQDTQNNTNLTNLVLVCELFNRLFNGDIFNDNGTFDSHLKEKIWNPMQSPNYSKWLSTNVKEDIMGRKDNRGKITDKRKLWFTKPDKINSDIVILITKNADLFGIDLKTKTIRLIANKQDNESMAIYQSFNAIFLLDELLAHTPQFFKAYKEYWLDQAKIHDISLIDITDEKTLEKVNKIAYRLNKYLS